MKNPEAVTVNKKFLTLISLAIDTALKYEALTGGKRKLGITGEVGEVLVCRQFGLRLVLDSRSEGFDAIDKAGRHVQIKTRRSESEDLPSKLGRVSRFSEHPFDYALLALLGHKYELCEIWQATYSALKPIIDRQKRRSPTLREFQNSGERVFESLPHDRHRKTRPR